MTVYHKLINGFMLNNYELGDITEEEALAQGNKTINEPQQDGKNNCAQTFYEGEHHLEVEWVEFPIPEPQEEEQ